MENKEKKIKIVEKLIKSGEITLEEGLLLLETEKEQVFIPYEKTITNIPYVNPWISSPPYYYGTIISEYSNIGVLNLDATTSNTSYIPVNASVTYTTN